MSDLDALYQELVLDHGRRPRNFGKLDHFSREAAGHNPLCGDRLHLYLDVDDAGVVRDVRFEGKGCAISTASASLMTQAVKGRPVAEAEALFERFHDTVTGKTPPDEERLGKLAVFQGVSRFPTRVKCATLCWHTLMAALKGADGPISTE
jgi:nitrogen fixation NifU-like protein